MVNKRRGSSPVLRVTAGGADAEFLLAKREYISATGRVRGAASSGEGRSLTRLPKQADMV